MASLNMMQIARFALIGLILLPLTGCDRGNEPGRITVCPRAGVLYDASRMIQFGAGPDRTVDNVAYDAEIGKVSIKCDNDGGVVDAEIKFALDVRAGPQGRVGSQTFRYFVAITELNQRVIDKQYYAFEAKFDVDKPRVYETKEIDDIRIPFKRLGRPDLYEILVGWDLTSEQLQYNRSTSQFDRPNLRRIERP